MHIRQDILVGNFNVESTRGGWRVGHFAKRPEFTTDNTEFQYVYEMKAGEHKHKAVYYKNCSTLTVLIEGELEIEFPHSKDHPKETLKVIGDYNFFGPNVCHKWKALKKTTLVSVRWPSESNDQVECDHKNMIVT